MKEKRSVTRGLLGGGGGVAARARPTELLALVSSRPEILEFDSVFATLGWQDLRWLCMDLLVSLSLSEQHWVVPYHGPSLVISRGRQLGLLSFFAKRLAIHLF